MITHIDVSAENAHFKTTIGELVNTTKIGIRNRDEDFFVYMSIRAGVLCMSVYQKVPNDVENFTHYKLIEDREFSLDETD